ncbi:hypothetical protein [Novosphingobium sp. JCM 18896]|uniref:hypothetical protein n=1 Tax=Novosphingobium sp. JCM 18896 TaxID=2989731 RepID=UPI00222297F5|nr:hypothetical protein [Novosphingobium sp. JCM 18896]MCW1431878.1 hypothetical protein [Novosphingobium sp. JCM 18896]
MRIIATAEDALAICDQPIDQELAHLLRRYSAILDEFGEGADAKILVIQEGEGSALAEQICGRPILADGRFAFPVELITRHDHWFEVVWIIADDGSGLVLLIEIAADTEQAWITACHRALAEMAP